MAPINLADFAQFSERIPTEYLNHGKTPSKTLPRRKILLAHLIDYGVILSIALTAIFFLEASLGQMMVTRRLMFSWRLVNLDVISITCLLTTMTSYFFFSYFFNQGQTLGLYVVKGRVTMPTMSFRSSLLWATYSMTMIMSFGLLAFRQSDANGFNVHDHLYFDLMSQERKETINLFDHLRAKADVVEDNFLKEVA